MSTPVRSHPIPAWSVDLLQVALVMHRGLLPEPISIDVEPRQVDAPVRVHVSRDDLAVWAEALRIGDVITEPRAGGTPSAHLKQSGRRGRIELFALAPVEHVEAIAS